MVEKAPAAGLLNVFAAPPDDLTYTEYDVDDVVEGESKIIQGNVAKI